MSKRRVIEFSDKTWEDVLKAAGGDESKISLVFRRALWRDACIEELLSHVVFYIDDGDYQPLDLTVPAKGKI